MSLLTSADSAARNSQGTRTGWLHLCNGLDPRRDGGMVPSILGFTGALARLSRGTTIVTPTPSRLDDRPLPEGVSLVGPERNLGAWVRSAEVVHLHGLWQTQTRTGARAARRFRVPHLIAAHGMAEPWALRQKALKKRVYTALVEGKNLRHADCLHALSRPEVEHLRALAPKTPICLVPNGVDLAPFEKLPDRSELERLHPQLRDKFNILFFGRLHVKKGLDLLVQALADVKEAHSRAHLILAGFDDGAFEPFREAAAALGLNGHYTYLGHVDKADASRVWGAADAFVLPSYSEGFSMAILEALAARKPVLITHACHFPDLAEARGGIVVEATRQGVAEGLRELLELSDFERQAMASNGRRLVEKKYTWKTQAERLASVYQWVSRGGSMPESVIPGGEIL